MSKGTNPNILTTWRRVHWDLEAQQEVTTGSETKCAEKLGEGSSELAISGKEEERKKMEILSLCRKDNAYWTLSNATQNLPCCCGPWLGNGDGGRGLFYPMQGLWVKVRRIISTCAFFLKAEMSSVAQQAETTVDSWDNCGWVFWDKLPACSFLGQHVTQPTQNLLGQGMHI